MLRPELLRAVIDCGFEHPSEVQHECIPQAILGMDIICQAKSGMGKTAVFVLATLQQLSPVDGEVSVLVMCHTRELAFQISKEYERFSKYLPSVKVGRLYTEILARNVPLRTRVLAGASSVRTSTRLLTVTLIQVAVFFGGMPIKKDEETLSTIKPHIVVGTPGRTKALVESGALNTKSIKYFVLDECDKMIGDEGAHADRSRRAAKATLADMRRDVQQIFKRTPTEKQVMMFSATLPKDLRVVCKRFMQQVSGRRAPTAVAQPPACSRWKFTLMTMPSSRFTVSSNIMSSSKRTRRIAN